MDPQKKNVTPSLAERTAADWIRPGGGYDQWVKGDAEREKRLPIGGMEPMESKEFKPKEPLKYWNHPLRKAVGRPK